jgi:hypothetical protein
MDFKRGHQMIIHDPRLWSTQTYGPPVDGEWWWGKAVRPPDAYNVWPVKKEDSAVHILSWAATVAKGADEGKGLDALHFMAHGNEAVVKLGKDWLHKNNVHLFSKLANQVGYIVFWSCLVGKVPLNAPILNPLMNIGGSPYGRRVAQNSRANVVMARQAQVYSWRKVGDAAVLDFGDWEGPVDVYSPDGPVQSYQADILSTAKFDVEKLIFGKP